MPAEPHYAGCQFPHWPDGQSVGHNAAMPERILVVEDDRTIARVVTTALRNVGLTTEVVDRGDLALEVASRGGIDLVVLDLTLPGLDGLEVCRQLRAQGEVPIIILSARGEEADRILGLEIGADDYITKPFSPRELVARVRAGLRRAEMSAAPTGGAITEGPLSMDPATREARLHGEPLDLTYMQFEVLAMLASAPRRVFTREELSENAARGAAESDPRSVDAHIRQIRRKIEPDPAQPSVIRAVRGIGYAFEVPANW
jgi:DNA-binding response OmpR family regulator